MSSIREALCLPHPQLVRRMRPPRQIRARSEDARAALRAEILENGRQLFLQHGYDAVSLRTLAATVGLTAAALYTYFPGKLALLRAIWAEDLQRLYQRVRGTGRQASLRQQLQTLVRYWLTHPDMFRVLFLIEDRTPDDGAMFIGSDAAQALIGLIRDAVCAQLPGVAAKQQQAEFEALWAAVQGVMTLAILVPEYGWAPARKLVDIQVDAFEARWRDMARP